MERLASCPPTSEQRRQAAAITTGVFAVLVPRPIPVTERQPGLADLGGFDGNCCWWGHWQDDHWVWTWDYEPVRDETHWLPAGTEVLPACCCPPEAHS